MSKRPLITEAALIKKATARGYNLYRCGGHAISMACRQTSLAKGMRSDNWRRRVLAWDGASRYVHRRAK
jgi:hypothetical protein